MNETLAKRTSQFGFCYLVGEQQNLRNENKAEQLSFLTLILSSIVRKRQAAARSRVRFRAAFLTEHAMSVLILIASERQISHW
jgi:hypothetical protein